MAPSAVLCGVVTLGERARVLHGAVLTAEDGEIWIGDDVVIMENALIRGRSRHPATVGDSVLIGPHAHLNGATVEDEVFIATGWVAVGDPAQLFSPDQHEALWQVQAELDFPGTVYGVPRGTPLRTIMGRQVKFYSAHQDDQLVDPNCRSRTN